MLKGYTKYSQAYKNAQVNTADQGRLIVLMYDGAIRYLQRSVEKMKAEDIYGANQNLIKGKSIITELLSSLDLEQGADIAANLQRLYTYMFSQLIDANLNKDQDAVIRVVELLKELREGWVNITGGVTPETKAEEPRGSKKRISVQG